MNDATSVQPIAAGNPTELLAATHLAVSRVTNLLRSLPVSIWSTPACGTWTIDQTAAHLAVGPIAYLEIVDQMLAGTKEPLFDVTDPDFDEAQLVMFGEASVQDRCDALTGSFAQFLAAAEQLPEACWGQPTWTPEGLMPTAAALGIGLNELTVHEFDIRSAAGLPVHIPPGGVPALAPFALHALAGLIRHEGWPAAGLAIDGVDPVLLHWVEEAAELTRSGSDNSQVLPVLVCGAAVLSLLTWGRLSVGDAVQAGLATVAGQEEDLAAVFAACTSI